MAIGVLLRTDPERRSIEQAHGGGHDAFLRGAVEPRSRTIVSRRTGSARANDSTRRNFVTSCRHACSWYRYCRRPAASTPTACRCPCGSAQITHPSTRVGSRVLGCAHRPPHRARGAPDRPRRKPRPAAAPRRPWRRRSTRRNRGTRRACPHLALRRNPCRRAHLRRSPPAGASRGSASGCVTRASGSPRRPPRSHWVRPRKNRK